MKIIPCKVFREMNKSDFDKYETASFDERGNGPLVSYENGRVLYTLGTYDVYSWWTVKYFSKNRNEENVAAKDFKAVLFARKEDAEKYMSELDCDTEQGWELRLCEVKLEEIK